MKKLRMWAGLLMLASSVAVATPADNLRQRLAKIGQFSADFSQRVMSPEGKTIHQAQGHFVIAKPGKLNWQETKPSQDKIIADGHTIWYYSPMLEQVTIYSARNAIVHTPFILLADQRTATWKGYQVIRKGQTYQVSAPSHPQQSKFSLQFNDANQISEFIVTDNQGQRSEFKLSHFKLNPKIKAKLFSFTVPKGTQVDDQRQH